MKTKVIQINGTGVSCSHEVVRDQVTGHSHIELTVEVGDVKTTHHMTIGAVDQPVSTNYGQEQAQKDFDAFRLRMASLAESHSRVKTLAEGVE
jgi:hypothetical protein